MGKSIVICGSSLEGSVNQGVGNSLVIAGSTLPVTAVPAPSIHAQPQFTVGNEVLTVDSASHYIFHG